MRLIRILYSEPSSNTHYKDRDVSMEHTYTAEKTLTPKCHICGFIALCKSIRISA